MIPIHYLLLERQYRVKFNELREMREEQRRERAAFKKLMEEYEMLMACYQGLQNRVRNLELQRLVLMEALDGFYANFQNLLLDS